MECFSLKLAVFPARSNLLYGIFAALIGLVEPWKNVMRGLNGLPIGSKPLRWLKLDVPGRRRPK
jgi:hypothetical protein